MVQHSAHVGVLTLAGGQESESLVEGGLCRESSRGFASSPDPRVEMNQMG